MADKETPKASPNNDPGTNMAKVADHIKKSGPMSTVAIMRALFEAQITSKNLSKLGIAIQVDAKAAQLNEDIRKRQPREIEEINTMIRVIQDKIDRLSTVKTAAQIAANYHDLIQPIRHTVAEISDGIKTQTDLLKAFNVKMHETFSAADQNGIKPKLNALAEEQHLMRTQTGKNFDAIFAIKNKINALGTEVERTAAASGVKSGQTQDAPSRSSHSSTEPPLS